MLATIQLRSVGLGWEIDDIHIGCEDGRVLTLGTFHQVMAYDDAVQQGKGLAMLKIRHGGRPDQEHQVEWRVLSQEP